MKKAHYLFRDVGGLFLEDLWAISRNFDKSLKLLSLKQNPNIICIFKFSYKNLYRVSKQIQIFYNQ